MEQRSKRMPTVGKLPGTIIADSGYGCEENYAYLENEQIEALVKYSTYHKEKSKKWQTEISNLDNWQYDDENYVDMREWTEACLSLRK
ncbi:hypothetical protein [Paenibacillus castaneae]|nr:hypothetical protein [Paenibacillus castaneae]